MEAKTTQAKIQKFGSTLSAMVMPNIGVFIGWGLLTAFVIDTGWIPNAYLNELVSPILTYCLPLLIGYTAGYNVYGRRGGVIGAFATMGMIVGSSVTMLVGGMIMGPLGAVCIRKFDRAVEGKVKPGLEMLVDNFSLGLIGLALCLLGYVIAAPILTTIENVLSSGVQVLCDKNLIPLAALFVQPAQILFLNNAINHGIMIPLGIEQAAKTGKSVLFLVEASGACWVGLAAAFAKFGNKSARRSAPGAVLIMFFGGIAEVCFPYCLTMPITILGPIAGNMFSLFVLTAFGGGTVGPVSPGSVIAYFMMTPKDSMLVNAIAYFGSLCITFVVTGFILKHYRQEETLDEEDAKGESTAANFIPFTQPLGEVNKIVFACDAGMGSSAMGVSILKKRLANIGLNPEIKHVAVSEIPNDTDIVVTNENLAKRAEMVTGGKIPILTLSNFMDESEYDSIANHIQQMSDKSKNVNQPAKNDVDDQKNVQKVNKDIFPDENIVLGAKFDNKQQAIEACADIFIKNGYTTKQYKQDMIERDKDVSVYIGNGVALPHGLSASEGNVLTSGICLIQVPDGVDFDGNMAYLLIGVAGKGEEHVQILGKLGEIMLDEKNLSALKTAKTKMDIKNVLKF
ncbi:PTS mannitol transporter subunit IICBA [Catenisphaera adipataccumulans]|jgi:PTS system mannitol-specific IIC component|uniref:Mannitol-specific phosphotransferase enzyme IIA component n=1 Tax=Catenisphaera adipataccumulans TaxID=700500 RepID=A0A7W8CXH9_9FIRM|nr:PTS mannitol transporter subunit IICBA [Catenisphaera adipataccumulans]MBB5182744.1 PTS system mannitol-specific IIC component [Catenisphaera adipataccumulans]